MSFFKSVRPNTAANDSVRPSNSSLIPVQAKLKSGEANDKQEKQADSIADKVASNAGLFGQEPFFAPPPTLRRSPETNQDVQKSEETDVHGQEKGAGSDKEEPVQKMPESDDTAIQTKAQNAVPNAATIIQPKEDEIQEKQEPEPVKDKAAENTGETPKTNSITESGTANSPNGVAQSPQENQETTKEEEGQRDDANSSGQSGSEKVEEVPNEGESTEVAAEKPGEIPEAEQGEKEGEGAEEVAEPKKGGKKDAKNAAFLNVVEKIKGTSEEQKTHDPAEQLSGEAQSSAFSPENERTSQAQAGLVNEMDAEAKEPKEFKAEVFKAKLMKRINEMDLPENLEEADEFKDNNKIDDVNKAALGDVNEQKEATVGSIDQATNQPPNPDAIPSKEVTPLAPVPVGDKPKSVSANQAVPDKRPDSEVKKPIQENTQRLDDTMAENEVTDQQLSISEEPTFEKALESKGVAKENAKTAPAALRQKEKNTLDANAEKAEGTSQEQLEGMNALRGTAVDKVVGGQQQTATKDTTERERIATEINTIYERTKKEVNTILGDLDKEVASKFKAASTKAKNAFESYCAREMAAYKRKRYSGLRGKGRWLKDVFMSLPDEVNQFYVDGKARFKKVMEAEITQIAELVARKLNQAKQRVETGKKEVTEYVNKLPANLKSLGKEAAEDIQEKFDELSEDVDATQDDLIDTLASEYQASLDEVNARIEEMKEANKGLVDKAMDMVKGVVETIKKLKEVISGLLSAISSVIPTIIAAPIEFMKNLFTGIGKGIDMFKANIQKHLMGGLLEWLIGSLGPMGIQMPDDIFSLKGIFSLVMQVLGVGWDYLRLKAVKMMGEPVVNALEKGWDMFKTFSKDGIAGIWEYMKDKFGDLKETVMDAIKDMLITKVIGAGIKWLLSLLIPGAGFVKAIMAIKDIIVFFVESAIMLIPAITEAILALAAGSIAGVGKAIELGLSKLISLVIGLFAKLIGLGGLAKKVKKIFTKVRKRVDRAVMKLLKKAKRAGRKLMRKLGIGKKDKKKGKEEKSNEKKKEVTVKRKFSMSKSRHTLTTTYKNGRVSVIMASQNPTDLVKKVNDEKKEHLENAKKTTSKKVRDKHRRIVSDLQNIIVFHDSEVRQIRKVKDFDKIRRALSGLTDKLMNKIVDVGNKHGLKDFVYDALEIKPSLDAIESTIKTQFEKHTFLHGTRGANAIGDGYNNTAMAAETHLGWIHQSGKLHTQKSMDSLAKLQTERSKLDEISDKIGGKMGIKDEVWYKRGAETEKDTKKAISSPLNYLKDKGQLGIYLGDIQSQRRSGRNIGYPHIIRKYKL